MSKLTNMQIRATIERLEATIRQGEADPRASTNAMRQRRRKLADYKAELAQHMAAGADPRTDELQNISIRPHPERPLLDAALRKLFPAQPE